MNEPTTIQIHDANVPVTFESNIEEKARVAVLAYSLFKNWARDLDPRFFVRNVTIQSVDMFGPRVGFIKFKADLTSRNKDGRSDGRFIPGITFMRGGSVGILVVLEVFENERGELIDVPEEHVVLTVQPRSGTTRYAFREIAAGMLDGGEFAGTAAKEMGEELGDDFAIREDQLTELSSVPNGKPIFFSPGGSDETCRLFFFRRRATRAELSLLQDRATGVLEEGEGITLDIVPIDELRSIPDMKTQLAYFLYEDYKRRQSAAA